MTNTITTIEPAESVLRPKHSDWYNKALEDLVDVVQLLSSARDLDTVMEIVRRAARDLTGADGATFVLRDGDKCYYAEEDAISPLWKGSRFPMNICISGWAMLHRQSVAIEDIYKDARIPPDAYHPTFVKSLAMVPIRLEDPIGAIGNYWAEQRQPSEEELIILQMLANFTSIAMANVELYTSLKNKIAALETSNAELDSFAWAASHDLKSPLRAIRHIARWVEKAAIDGDEEKVAEHVSSMHRRIDRMQDLLASILEYARVNADPSAGDSEIADGQTLKTDIADLIDLPDGFSLDFDDTFDVICLPRIPAQRVFINLIGNSIKHHDRDEGRIAVRTSETSLHYHVSVEDDGPGIRPEHREKAFEMFQTLQPRDRVDGSGMGLPMVRKILSAHGGRISLRAGADRGVVFDIVWPKVPPEHDDAD